MGASIFIFLNEKGQALSPALQDVPPAMGLCRKRNDRTGNPDRNIPIFLLRKFSHVTLEI